MTQDEQTARAEAARIAHAITDMAARTTKGSRISFAEIMAIHSGQADTYVRSIAGEDFLSPRKCGALDQ